MGPEGSAHDVQSLSDYMRVVRRRKWLILATALLFPVAAVLYSLQQKPLYTSSAEVLISRNSIVASVTGTPDPAVSPQADRVAKTQAGIASVPAVAERVLEATGVTDLTPEEFLKRSEVQAARDADLLVFRVTAGDPELAALLAGEYARQFTIYRRELDTAHIRRAREGLEDRIRQLAKAGQRGSPQHDRLVAKAQELRTTEALITGNTTVIRDATNAKQIQPRPVRNGFLAAGLGLIFAIVLAFLRDALDTRIRSAEEIGERLGVPLLARIPEPPRRLRARNRLVMLAEPNGTAAEPFRMLRTNLDFVNLQRAARAIMVTSATEGEGKSTTAANLAVALARAGKHVVLVDLDLRRPFIDRFFDLEDRPGLTNVVLGHATLDEALAPVAITDAEADGRGWARNNGEENGHAPVAGFLEVIGSGPTPPDPGEFVATLAVSNILGTLRARADFVLVDAPPVLQVGDAMTLSAKVDGVLVVTRAKLLRRPHLTELQRVLAASPARTVGFIVTGSEPDHGYAYGYTSEAPAPAYKRETERVR